MIVLVLLVGLLVVAPVIYLGAAGPRKALRDIDHALGAMFRRISLGSKDGGTI